ncbi:MAG: DUF4851 domain-containing protein [Pseudomonadota bacterium]
MIRILIPIVLICLILGACTLMKRRPLQRGLVGDTFVSTGQPAFALQAQGPLRLTSAGVMDLQLQSPQLGSSNASASCWYALYASASQSHDMPITVNTTSATHDTSKPSALLAFLTDAKNPWQWEMSVASGQLEVHVDSLELDGKPAHAATFVLPQGKDPWAPLMANAAYGQAGDTLVRRFTLLMQQRRAKLIIEYREPITATTAMTVRPLEDFAALAAFEQRALDAFTLHTSPAGNPPTVTQLTYAPDYIQRKAVAASLGLVRRSNQRD